MKEKYLTDPLSDSERVQIREELVASAPLMNEIYREETQAWYPLEEEVAIRYEAAEE